MVKKIALREVRMLKVCTVHYNILLLGTNSLQQKYYGFFAVYVFPWST